MSAACSGLPVTLSRWRDGFEGSSWAKQFFSSRAYAIAYTALVPADRRTRVASDLLRLARVKAGLTQAELARRAGVAQALISSYENGHRQPTLPALIRLLEAAGFELRMRLEEPDVQSRAAEEWQAGRPAAERDQWAKEQAAVSAGRQ
jgi:transcriptional regulator with XRE-family HTH domain